MTVSGVIHGVGVSTASVGRVGVGTAGTGRVGTGVVGARLSGLARCPADVVVVGGKLPLVKVILLLPGPPNCAGTVKSTIIVRRLRLGSTIERVGAVPVIVPPTAILKRLGLSASRIVSVPFIGNQPSGRITVAGCKL